MGDDKIPVKTQAGQAELGTRRLLLSQRHRTMLFLVDGRRSASEVKRLAGQAGVPAACLDELLELRFVSSAPDGAAEPLVEGDAAGSAMESLKLRPQASARLSADVDAHAAADADANANANANANARSLPATQSRATPPDASSSQPAVQPGFQPTDAAFVPTEALLSVRTDSLLPSAAPLLSDSASFHSAPSSAPAPPASRAANPVRDVHAAREQKEFRQARDTLVRVVRSEAPLAGSLTVLKLRRASSRAELVELLGEVEGRIGRRHRSLAATQTLQSVRQLLRAGWSPSLPGREPRLP